MTEESFERASKIKKQLFDLKVIIERTRKGFRMLKEDGVSNVRILGIDYPISNIPLIRAFDHEIAFLEMQIHDLEQEFKNLK